MTGWTRGVRLAVDVGTVRIGVARCDPDGILATPVSTVARAAATTGTSPESFTQIPSDMTEIKRLVEEYEAVQVIVGMPITLGGVERQAAAAVREYAAALATLIDPVPVVFTDERMSTAVAARRLSERGVRGRRQRAVVDQAAAVEILQSWLDTQRRRT